MNGFSRIARVLPAIVLCIGAAQGNPRVLPAEDSAAGAATLREGTPVPLAFDGGLSSKTASPGDTVNLVLATDLRVGGVTVAKAGSKVSGHVTSVKRAAAPGRSGALSLQLDYLQAGDVTVKLRGSKDRNGNVAIQYSRPSHLKWPMGLLRTGDEIEIAQGTMLTVFVAEEISLPAVQ
jgi:hypothetical protein